MKKIISSALIITLTMANFSCSSDDDLPTVLTVITTSDFTTSIDENVAQATSLGSVAGTSNTGSITFTITTQTPSGALLINSSTGGGNRSR